MGKKKVLYIITKSVWGGAGKYIHDLAINLPARNALACEADGPKEKFEAHAAMGGKGPLAQKLKQTGIPCHNIKNFQKDVNVLKEFFAGFEILSLLFKIRPDIIHVNSSKAGGIVGVAFLIYKLFNIGSSPMAIFTAHGWAFNESRPPWQIFLIKFFSRITCLFYDKIICVSEFDRIAAIRNKIAPEKKLTTIHNGIKTEDYNFYEKTEKRFTIGTIGEATKNKGHEYLKEAAKYFPDINFNIVTDLPDAAKYLKNFDIFILPSLKEGLPYVLLEAGLAELPVIATSVGGVPEIIENEKTGLLIKPASSDEIKKAIEKLIANPGLAESLAKNLRQKILNEFGFEKMLTLTLTAYEKNESSRK